MASDARREATIDVVAVFTYGLRQNAEVDELGEDRAPKAVAEHALEAGCCSDHQDDDDGSISETSHLGTESGQGQHCANGLGEALRSACYLGASAARAGFERWGDDASDELTKRAQRWS